MLKKITTALFVVVTSLLSLQAAAQEQGLSGFADDLGSGYRSLYSSNNLPWLGKTWLVGGIIANTDLDRKIQNSYNTNIQSNASDDFSVQTKKIGDTSTTLIYFGLAAVNRLARNRDCGVIPEWGDRTAQALLVGLPAVWTSQAVLGGDRPYRGDSSWTPFEFHRVHAVSGHAFVGAVPFLTAAQMTNNPYAKATFYALSPLTAISRINDQKHYLSQDLMGWTYAAKVTDVPSGKLQHEDTVVRDYVYADYVLLNVIKAPR